MKEGFHRLKLLPTIKTNTLHILENEENFNSTSYISIYFLDFLEISQKSYSLNKIIHSPKIKSPVTS